MKASDLCLDCGLCCNGVLHPGIVIEKSKMHLFKSEKTISSFGVFIKQPCEHLDDCNLCKIYNIRPDTCQEYKCRVLKNVEKNEMSFDDAKTLINNLKKNPNDKSLKKKFYS